MSGILLAVIGMQRMVELWIKFLAAAYQTDIIPAVMQPADLRMEGIGKKQ